MKNDVKNKNIASFETKIFANFLLNSKQTLQLQGLFFLQPKKRCAVFGAWIACFKFLHTCACVQNGLMQFFVQKSFDGLYFCIKNFFKKNLSKKLCVCYNYFITKFWKLLLATLICWKFLQTNICECCLTLKTQEVESKKQKYVNNKRSKCKRWIQNLESNLICC